MTQLAFGAGALWGISTATTNPTPVRFGVLQNAALDFSASTKSLFGSNQLPVSVARGAVTISGKAAFAQLTGRLVNDLFFGSTMASGQILVSDSESQTIPASSPYTVTSTNSSTWTVDLGVVYAATNIPLVRVASSPATGQYTVAAGIYTFAVGDEGSPVKISYQYTATGGDTLTVVNQPMGQATTFKTVLSIPYNNQRATFTLNACVASKMSLATVLEDFMKPSFEWNAFVDSSGTLGTISVAEVS